MNWKLEFRNGMKFRIIGERAAEINKILSELKVVRKGVVFIMAGHDFKIESVDPIEKIVYFRRNEG